MVVDDVGLLLCAHCCSYLLNALETQTRLRRNKQKRRTLHNKFPKPLRRDRAPKTSVSPAMLSTRHVTEPLGRAAAEKPAANKAFAGAKRACATFWSQTCVARSSWGWCRHHHVTCRSLAFVSPVCPTLTQPRHRLRRSGLPCPLPPHPSPVPRPRLLRPWLSCPPVPPVATKASSRAPAAWRILFRVPDAGGTQWSVPCRAASAYHTRKRLEVHSSVCDLGKKPSPTTPTTRLFLFSCSWVSVAQTATASPTH